MFNLIGTTYGGDGQSTFALPDLRGRIPLHQGNGDTLAQTGGAEAVTLTLQQIPSHNHQAQCSSQNGTQPDPGNGVWAAGLAEYTSGAPNAPMNVLALGQTGGSQPHDNMMPYLAISFIISLFGIFPSQG